MSKNIPFSLDEVVMPPVPTPEVITQTTIEVSIEPKRVLKLRDLHPDKFFVSQSDMKAVLSKGDEKAHCPLRFVEETVNKAYRNPPTEAMLAGSYAETLCLGSGASGKMTLDMPRKIISAKKMREHIAAGGCGADLKGDKTIDQERIEVQAMRFEHRVAELKMKLTDNNKQVSIMKYLWGNVFLIGELDIFPTRIQIPEGIKLAVIDLKFTANVNSKWGDFCWGAPEFMDHLQAKTYHELIRNIDLDLNPHLLPLLAENPKLLERANNGDIGFAYWIFGYKATPAEDQEKIIWYDYDAGKRNELMESVRKYEALVRHYGEMNSVPTNPNFDFCKDCPVSILKNGYCTDCKTTQTL